MNKLERYIKTTADGSHTLFVPEIGECYHSTHGALQESQLVFITYGLQQACKLFPHIHVLEIGFGTGLNALLSLLEAEKRAMRVDYFCVEPYPVSNADIELLNYNDMVEHEYKDYFRSLHQAEWNKCVPITPWFSLHKAHATFQDVQLPVSFFNLVYMDAFSPEAQPEMWQQDVFDKISKSCVPQAVLTTYCCKGIVKQALRNAGFVVKKLPGPPGKREVLQAIVKVEKGAQV